jgi:hypothetical protein
MPTTLWTRTSLPPALFRPLKIIARALVVARVLLPTVARLGLPSTVLVPARPPSISHSTYVRGPAPTESNVQRQLALSRRLLQPYRTAIIPIIKITHSNRQLGARLRRRPLAPRRPPLPGSMSTPTPTLSLSNIAQRTPIYMSMVKKGGGRPHLCSRANHTTRFWLLEVIGRQSVQRQFASARLERAALSSRST